MKIDQQTMLVLFLVFIIILAVFPKPLHRFYKTILGRIVLISIVIYFTVNDMTLGLLMALVIIAAANQFSPFVEGMEIQETGQGTKQGQGETIGDDNEEVKPKVQGVDKEDIKIAVMSKASNSIPVKTTTSEDVSASTEGLLGSSRLEGFASI